MEGVSQSDVTGLLKAWRGGSRDALEQLIPTVHQELRRIAQRYVSRERSGQTLQATALVNEAYLRLVNIREVVSLDRSGNSMTGTVSLDFYAADATTLLGHIADGTVSGTRITP